MLRYIIIGIVIFLIIPIAWVAWWLLSPLITTTQVEEDFPLAARATVPENMSMAEVESLMEMASAINTQVSEEMPAMPAGTNQQETPAAELTGQFRDADAFHKGSGTATVYNLGDNGPRVLRLSDFNVTNGPDLRVILAYVPDPIDRDQLSAGGYVEIAKLKGNAGSQNYEIPDDVDLGAVRSVVIYCRPFHVVFSVATLAAPTG
jgi:hypothetical protein